MQIIAIDGACRRNGKPDCVSAGAIFVKRSDMHYTETVWEAKSTNQRGELLALLKALDFIYASRKETLVVTDSEYIFNAMTKSWYTAWMNNDWSTREGNPVKNKDIWLEIMHAYNKCNEVTEVVFYHIKGHVIPFGTVTASRSLSEDCTGSALSELVAKRFDELLPEKTSVIEAAQELSEKNNGYRLTDAVFKDFVVANIVVDSVATLAVELADKKFVECGM